MIVLRIPSLLGTSQEPHAHVYHPNNGCLFIIILSKDTNIIDINQQLHNSLRPFYSSLGSWQSKVQHITILSNTKAEYITTTKAGREVIYLNLRPAWWKEVLNGCSKLRSAVTT